MKIIIYTTGLLTTMAFVLGWVFAILHMPGGSELMIYGFLGFVFIFLPWQAYDYFGEQRALVDKVKFVVGLTSGLLVALSLVFKLLHLQGAPTMLVIGTGLFILGFLPLLFLSIYRKSTSR